MFLSERQLKENFWENYNYSGRALRYEFESPLRDGNTDLVTVEIFQDNVQINAFEFKLSDIKKAILQAKENSKYVNKSWIVIPSEKENLILDRYKSYLKEIKYVGVIVVEESGRWKMIFKPIFRKNINIKNNILKLMLLEI